MNIMLEHVLSARRKAEALTSLSDAREVIAKYETAQVDFVKKAYAEFLEEVATAQSENRPDRSGEILNSYEFEAEADNLLTTEEFNELWKANEYISKHHAHESVMNEAKTTYAVFPVKDGEHFAPIRVKAKDEKTAIALAKRQNSKYRGYDWECEVVEAIIGGDEEALVEKAGVSASKMTRRGQEINDINDAQFPNGTLVEIRNPDDSALGIKRGVKGTVVGKVKKTYIYNFNDLAHGGQEDNKKLYYDELDANAPQSCEVEVHEDYKIKQHGQGTNRVIVPVSFLVEIDEDDYKRAINKIPRKGLDKLMNKNKKRIESTDKIRKNFNFKCRDCENEFVDSYDYPLPTDCNACVYCPECGGVACVSSSEPIEE